MSSGSLPIIETVQCPKWGRRAAHRCEQCPFFGGFSKAKSGWFGKSKMARVNCKYTGRLERDEILGMEEQGKMLSVCMICQDSVVVTNNDDFPLCGRPECFFAAQRGLL